MTTYGDQFSTSIPAVGASGPQYAADMNAIMTDIMTRLASKVPVASLLVTTDLNLANFNLINATSIGLVNNSGTGLASAVPRIMAANGNLYFIGPSGTVQMTAGTSLNAAGLAGITGDYGGANPAQFRYDSANARYDAFANQTTGQWGFVRALGFDIAASSLAPTIRARLAFGGGSSVTYTLPSAAPASQQLMQMDTSGNITTSNGLAVNQSLFLTGTGHIVRGQRSTTIPLEFSRFIQFLGATGVTHATGSPVVGIPGGADVAHPIQMPDADNFLTTITSVDVIRDASGGSMTCSLHEGGYPAGFTAVATATITGTASVLTIPITGGYSPSNSNNTLWVRVQNSTGVAQSVGAVVLHSTVA